MPLPRRVPPRVVLIAAGIAAFLALGFIWLRDSSLVAVDDVTVTGITGPQAARVRSALESAARDMTTLHADAASLRRSVAAYPQVKSLRVVTHFPHSMDIEVIEHNPVAAIVAGGRSVAVAADGTLLRDQQPGDVATVQMSSVPGGDRLADPRAFSAVQAMGAAPAALRGHVVNVWTGAHGLTARLRDGPLVYFGSTARLAAKWAAVTRVLADSEARGALYLDVRVPERTAAGGLAAPTSTQPSTGG